MRLRSLALVGALALLAIPSSASAAVNVTAFSVTPSTTQAGGHPNLTMEPGLPGWATSIYNPEINIELGIRGISRNRERMKENFEGCTEEQYTLMAIGEYNSYGTTQSCTEINTEYVEHVLEAYYEYSEAAGWPASNY